jgi:hypothetical protein
MYKAGIFINVFMSLPEKAGYRRSVNHLNGFGVIVFMLSLVVRESTIHYILVITK